MADQYLCKWCGYEASNISSLTAGNCARNPAPRGKHELYEGSKKQRYSCKHCGYSTSSIASLTAGICARHPTKGRHHEPAL